MSARRSQRTRSLRNWWSQLRVRSTTQRVLQETELAQADELADLRHKTLALKEQQAQRWLGVEPLKRRYLEARLEARIRRLDLQFRTVEEPRRKVLDRWEQQLRAWKRGVTGCANFESQT